VYLHKYTSDGETFYLVSSKSAKPGGSIVLSSKEWKGYSTGSDIETAVKLISGSKFSKDVPEEPKKEPVEKKKKAFSELIRMVATRSDDYKKWTDDELWDEFNELRKIGGGDKEFQDRWTRVTYEIKRRKLFPKS